MIREALKETTILLKNVKQKDVISGLILLTSFSAICFALYPYTPSKNNLNKIAITKLPQISPTDIPTPTPTIFNARNQQDKENSSLYKNDLISPTITNSPLNRENNSTTSSASISPTQVVPTTTMTTANPESKNPQTYAPTPTVTRQNNTQPIVENNTPNQSTPPQTDPTTKEQTVVGTVVKTVGALTSNILQTNQ